MTGYGQQPAGVADVEREEVQVVAADVAVSHGRLELAEQGVERGLYAVRFRDRRDVVAPQRAQVEQGRMRQSKRAQVGRHAVHFE